MTDKTVLLTSGASWDVPEDFSAANSVECIGGGQGGNDTSGGAGGDYAKVANLALNPGDTVGVQIGSGGAGVASGTQNAGGDTSFGSAVLAKGGGSASTDVGEVSYAGGAGSDAGAGGAAAGAGGAGQAASGTTPGTGDGDLAGGGGAAASTAPTVVQIQGSSKATSASTRVVNFAQTPTAGNVLCILYNSNSATDNLTAVPAGWTRTLCTGAVYSFGMLTKTSDGTESSVTLNFNTNVPVPVCYAEVDGTMGTTSFDAPGTNSAPPWAIGPTDAPPAPNSIPLVGFFVRNRGSSPLIPPEGWTGVDATGSSSQAIGLMYGPPTDSAVNAMVSSGSSSIQATAWINLWVSPP